MKQSHLHITTGTDGTRVRLLSVVAAEGLPKKSVHRTYLTPIRFSSTTEAAAVEATEGQEAAGEPAATEAAPGSKQQRNRRAATQGRRPESIGAFLNSMSNSIRRFNNVNRGDFLSAVHCLRQAPCTYFLALLYLSTLQSIADIKYELPLRTSKERTVGPNGASLLLQSTGEVLVWLPRTERARLTQEVSMCVCIENVRFI